LKETLEEIAGYLCDISQSPYAENYKKHEILLEIIEKLPLQMAITLVESLLKDLFPEGRLKITDIISNSENERINFYGNIMSLYVRLIKDSGDTRRLDILIRGLRSYVFDENLAEELMARYILGSIMPFNDHSAEK